MNPNLELTAVRLMELGAVNHGSHFETNIILENSGSSLLASGRLLRLRHSECSDKTSAVLTLKMKPEKENQKKDIFKIKEELETFVGSFNETLNIFHKLGYKNAAIYEKARQTWSLQIASGTDRQKVTIELDKLPFCDAIELEGQPEAIEWAATALALDKSQISIKSYHELHADWLSKNNLPKTLNIIFDKNEKARLRASLGLKN